MAFKLDNLNIDFENAKYFDGVHFFPIISDTPTPEANYRFLWEGMEEKNVEVEELKDSSVPTVLLKNKSNEAFIAYRGNIIRGGGQNRQILHSFVVPAQQSVKMPVQCIQQGRWNPHQKREFSQKSGEVTSSTMRFKQKSQSMTWESIREQSTHNYTTSVSSDYTVLKDYYLGSHDESLTAESSIHEKDLEQQKKRLECREKAQKMLQEMEKPLPNQVGMYVVLVDADEFLRGTTKQMQCLELFGNPSLYQKAHREVVASFVGDAVMYMQGQSIELPKTSLESFQNFLKKVNEKEWKKSETSVGTEQRLEIPNSENVFGESIIVNDDMLHLMCSIH